MKRMLPVLVVVVIAGCSTNQTNKPASSPSAPASSSSTTAPAPPPPSTVTVTAPASSAPAPGPPAPAAAGQCSDDDLAVTNGSVQSANTLRRVELYFRNTSTHQCTLTGYPGADLVTPAGGVLIHVARRPANAAHHLTLNPGDVATADVQAYAIDTASGNSCPRYGALVVIPPNDFVSHTLNVDLPICEATISSVD